MHQSESRSTTVASPESELESLKERMRQCDYGVVVDLARLQERHPDNLEILRQRIYAHSVRCEHREAIDLCRGALEVAPGDSDLKLCIADRLVNLGQFEVAKAEYQRISEAHPDCEGAAMGVQCADHFHRHGSLIDREKIESPLNRQTHTDKQTENLERNQRAFKQRKRRLRSLPTALNLEGTTKCNFFCQTCLKGHGAYFAADMGLDVITEVRRSLLPYAVRIGISGFGEPTIGRTFDELLDASVSEGASLDMTTNGTGLNIRRIEQMICHKVAVNISIDGATKATFEKIRLGGNFEQLLSRLALIQRLRRIHIDQPLSAWHFNFVALRSNVHELPGVIELAAKYDIASVHIIDYSQNWTEFDSESLRNEPELARHWFGETRKLAKELGVDLIIPADHDQTSIALVGHRSLWQKIRDARHLLPQRDRFSGRCSAPWDHPFIGPEGDVMPCCLLPSMGSIRETPFHCIWNSWRYRVLRWRVDSALPPLGCRNCHVEVGINGGNPGNAIAKEGLIIKVAYKAEVALQHLHQRIKRTLQRMRGRHAAPAPNFHRGRPISRAKRAKSHGDAAGST